MSKKFSFFTVISEKFSGISKYGARFQAKEKKKKIILGIAGLVVIGVISQLTSKEEKKETKQLIRTQKQVYQQQKEDASKAQAIVIPGTKVNSQDIWMVEGQKKISQVEQVNTQLTSTVDQVKSRDDVRDQQIKELNNKFDTLTSKFDTQQAMIAKASSSAVVVGVKAVNSASTDTPQIQEIDMDANEDTQSSGNINNPSIVNSPNQQNNTTNNSNSKDKKKLMTEYIPSNTVIKGFLTEGISANTGGNSNSEPTPVLIELISMASLPNFFKINVKHCRVGGSGYGDLSTERVKIRLDKLSCVLKNGHVIDIPVKGHVSGEDGKAGIKGIVITHNGAALAKAALAGTLGGLSNAAQMASQTQMVSPVGVTNTVNPNQAFGSAVAGGAANGFNTLSQYYTNMLNQITPAIEVSSGRNVDVVIQEGAELKESLGNSEINSDSPLPFNELNR